MQEGSKSSHPVRNRTISRNFPECFLRSRGESAHRQSDHNGSTKHGFSYFFYIVVFSVCLLLCNFSSSLFEAESEKAIFDMRNIGWSVPSLVVASLSVLQLFAKPARCVWPDTPFTTSGRDMISASGQHMVYAGVNWPGAADTMLPE